MIHYFEHTTSTNDLARGADYRHMDVVWAGSQSAGRGQRGHKWHSIEGENLTFSVVLEPHFLPIVEQFMLSEVVALALVDTLRNYGLEARIKWTNDIYVGDYKIAGVLIEQMLATDHIARTIVGIGLNIQQTDFPDDLPNPTSMRLEGAEGCSPREVLEVFMLNLERWYSRLVDGDKDAISQRYNSLLYHRDEPHTYAYASGERFEATIRRVQPTGHLVVEHADGTISAYAFKEIEFCLPQKRRR